MAGGVYDSLNFEQKWLKMAWYKIFFIPYLFLTKCVRIISFERFLFKKNCFRWFFNKKVRDVCGGFHAYSGQLGVIYDSQGTNRSTAGGRGALTGSPPCLLLVAWESYTTPSRTTTHFFVAILIRDNRPSQWKLDSICTYFYTKSNVLVASTFWTVHAQELIEEI